MQKLMGDEGWGGGLFFSTDPKCLCLLQVRITDFEAWWSCAKGIRNDNLLRQVHSVIWVYALNYMIQIL